MSNHCTLRRAGRHYAILLATIVVAVAAQGEPASAQEGASAASSDIPSTTKSPARARYLASYDSVVTAIARTYFDTAFIRTRWQPASDSLRVRASSARTPVQFRAAVGALLSTVPASHFYLIPAEVMSAVSNPDTPDGDAGAGMQVRIAERRVVVWRVDSLGPAGRGGVRPGDAIVRIGNTKITPALERVLALRDTHAQRRALLELAGATHALLRGAAGSAVELQVERVSATGTGPRTMRLIRTASTDSLVQFGALPPLHIRISRDRHAVRSANGAGEVAIGAIGFNIWLPTVLPLLDDAVDRMRGCHALVIDLRGNPGGVAHMVAGVAGHLMDSAVSLGAMHARASTLRFVVNPRRVTADGRLVSPFAGPVALLVDEHSASTSEIFAGALQAIGRARIFGERSAGQALLAHTRLLPTGDVLVHAIADLIGPRGERFEGAGVIPDEHVPLRRAELARNVDAPRAAALRWASSQPSAPPSSNRCEP